LSSKNKMVVNAVVVIFVVPGENGYQNCDFSYTIT